MTGAAARRWPCIARHLGGADDPGDTTSAVLLDAVESALTAGSARARTLAQVLAPVRAYLLWALDGWEGPAERPFEGGSVFAGEIGRSGRPPVRVRVELQALGAADDRLVNAPPGAGRPAPGRSAGVTGVGGVSRPAGSRGG
ncbi:hypothetical protein [Kitasatospora sp. NBC_00315]|uniref:hypothetical protein n=1 Tax=Kitasatospora sp. NBC_00315 TaxID=2975963 RepID=UPI00324E310E